MAARNATPRNNQVAIDLDERIVTTSELLDVIPLDRSTIWRMARAGVFPKPIQLTESRIGWRWSAVKRWLDEREAHPPRRREYFHQKKTA